MPWDHQKLEPGPQGDAMRVSIYLFRAEASAFSDLLREFPSGSREPERRRLKDGITIFGLRVTANMADPFKVAAIQVRTLSENSRQQRSQTANRTRVAEFDVEVEREWLRYLKADVSDGVSWASGVGGSQSLSLTTRMDLRTVAAGVRYRDPPCGDPETFTR
ncbi:TIGR04141 family sporadically distributed protein [Streptomyces sp. NPDC005722]